MEVGDTNILQTSKADDIQNVMSFDPNTLH